MSAIYMNVFLTPNDNESYAKLSKFVEAINDGNFKEIINEHGIYAGMITGDYDEEEIEEFDEPGFEPEDILEDLENMFIEPINLKAESNVKHMYLEAATVFEPISFVDFLFYLGAIEIEASVFNSQTGTYEFYKNKEETETFSDYSWKWLKEPIDSNDE